MVLTEKDRIKKIEWIYDAEEKVRNERFDPEQEDEVDIKTVEPRYIIRLNHSSN